MDHRTPRFQIIERIGQGQFSNVYKARIIYPKIAPSHDHAARSQSNQHQVNGQQQQQPQQISHEQFGPKANFNQQQAPTQSSMQLIDFNTDLNKTSTCNSLNQTNSSSLNGLINLNQNHSDTNLLDTSNNYRSLTLASNSSCNDTILKNDSINTTVTNVGQQQQQFVALKRVKFYEIQNSKMRTDCIKEVKLLQQLKHPNIINYSISFIERNELYIVLEFADGGDLSKLINYFQKKKMFLSEISILKYFSQVCSAVRYIHSKRILHRDIKPANIFMTSAGCVKLGDFGLGRFFGQNTRNAHSYVGTFYYMSPERIREWGYDFSSDVWSIGCVLYELITLYSPFSILFNHNSNNQNRQQSNLNHINNNNNCQNNNKINSNQQQQTQLQQVNPFNLQWIVDRILKADYPSLAPYTNISLELRNLAIACLSLEPNDRPNMDVICLAVSVAQNRLSTRLTTNNDKNI